MRPIAFVLANVIALSALPALAQESAGVTWSAPRMVDLPAPWLSTLRAAAAHGDSGALVAAGQEFIKDLNRSAPKDTAFPCCDLSTQYVVLLFTSFDVSDKPSLVHVLLHSPGLPGARFPGLGSTEPVVEVFLAEDSSVAIQGTYEVERLENPALKQAGDFTSAVLGKLTLPGALNLIRGTASAATRVMMMSAGTSPAAPRVFPHGVVVGQVRLPYKRAKFSVKHSVTVVRPVNHARSRVQAVAAELIALRTLRGISRSGRVPKGLIDERQWDDLNRALGIDIPPPAGVPEAKAKKEEPGDAGTNDDFAKMLLSLTEPQCVDLIRMLEASLTRKLDDPACRFAVADQAECFKAARAELSNTLSTNAGGDHCSANDAVAVATAFAPAIAATGRISGMTAIANQPTDRFSFGLASGYLGDVDTAAGYPRVQLQNGKFAPNPFGRSITMATINLPLWGYDGSTFTPELRERVRPFVGLPFSPNFGVAVGGSFAITRSLAINAGVVRLWYDTIDGNQAFDDVPVDKTHPFGVKAATGWFIGAGYALK